MVAHTYEEQLREMLDSVPIAFALYTEEEERARRLADMTDRDAVLHGFSSILMYFAEFYEDVENPAFKRLVEIVVSDVVRGFSAALSNDSQVLSNVCRSLMEVTILLTEWCFEPGRIAQWWNADEKERRSVFAYGKVLDRVHRYLEIDEQHVLHQHAHYRTHSRWLHPSPDDSAAVTPTLELALDELIGHTNRTAYTVNDLALAQPDLIRLPKGRKPDTFPAPWLELVARRDDRQDCRYAMMAIQGFEVVASPLLPRNWTSSDIVRPMVQKDAVTEE